MIRTVNSEEFNNGKYFAHIKDSQNITWKIIISKQDNILKVLLM